MGEYLVVHPCLLKSPAPLDGLGILVENKLMTDFYYWGLSLLLRSLSVCFVVFSEISWLSLFLSDCVYIYFDAVTNWVVFLISFLECSLIVYRNTTDFCILVLYYAAFLSSLVSSNSFWWIHWDFLCVRPYYLWMEIDLLLSFPHSSVDKESACSAGDPGLIPGLGRSAEKG